MSEAGCPTRRAPSRASRSRTVGAHERDLIQDALKTTRGNMAKAARLLDTTERVVRDEVKIHAIDAARFKA